MTEMTDKIKQLFTVAVDVLNENNKADMILDLPITSGAIRVTIESFSSVEELQAQPLMNELLDQIPSLVSGLIYLRNQFAYDQQLVTQVERILADAGLSSLLDVTKGKFEVD